MRVRRGNEHHVVSHQTRAIVNKRALRDGSKINWVFWRWVFWRNEDKAAKEGEAGILLIRRCSLTLAAVAAVRQNAEVIFESFLRVK